MTVEAEAPAAQPEELSPPEAAAAAEAELEPDTKREADRALQPEPSAQNGKAAANGDQAAAHKPRPEGSRRRTTQRTLEITFRTCGELERDKFRLREIYETVRNPRGRDRFVILLQSRGKTHTLAFPEDPCSISERLLTELDKRFRVAAEVTEEA